MTRTLARMELERVGNVETFMAEYLPEIKAFHLQGTYLQWLDFNALGLGWEALEQFMQREAHLFLDEGYVFGEDGKGFERINLACPARYLEKAMERLLGAVNRLKGKA